VDSLCFLRVLVVFGVVFVSSYISTATQSKAMSTGSIWRNRDGAVVHMGGLVGLGGDTGSCKLIS
jgi:hypothetical protein